MINNKKNTIKSLCLLLVIISANSCSFIAKTFISSKFSDAKVETTLSTKQFQLDNSYDTTNSFIINADTSDAYKWMQMSIASDFQIFDSVGNILEYKGEKSCGGSIFYDFINGNLDSFKVEKATYNLKNLLQKCYDYSDIKGNFETLPKTNYYVVTFWSKFAGGKFGYKQGVKFYEEAIRKQKKQDKKITLIKINTDLQEKWGLEQNGKAKVKIEVIKREATITIGKLPWKN